MCVVVQTIATQSSYETLSFLCSFFRSIRTPDWLGIQPTLYTCLINCIMAYFAEKSEFKFILGGGGIVVQWFFCRFEPLPPPGKPCSDIAVRVLGICNEIRNWGWWIASVYCVPKTGNIPHLHFLSYWFVALSEDFLRFTGAWSSFAFNFTSRTLNTKKIAERRPLQ